MQAFVLDDKADHAVVAAIVMRVQLCRRGDLGRRLPRDLAISAASPAATGGGFSASYLWALHLHHRYDQHPAPRR